MANSPSNFASKVTPLARRYSAPAEVSAEFFAGVAPFDDEACARKRLEQGGERGIADPVVRPGHPRAQSQRGLGIEQQRTVEAPAQLAAGIARVTGIKAERKSAGVEIGLVIRRRVERLRLDCHVRREPAIEGGDAIAALDAAAERLRVEARAEMVAGKGEAVGRHPVKRLGPPYRSGRSRDWIKSKNPAAPAVKREAEED